MLKSHSLKVRFARTVLFVYAVLGLLVYLVFHLVVSNIVSHLGTEFATKQALLEKSKMMSSIQHDLSLSLQMADSPILRRWMLDENNPALRRYAGEELESYRRNLAGHSLFVAIGRSGHYYFDAGKTPLPFDRLRYTLSPANVNDAWYFRAMRTAGDFELNVDHDNHLNVTKVWFNVAIKDSEHRKIGLCGSGIDITDFIDDIVKSRDRGVETILFRQNGAITGDCNPQYVLHNSKLRDDAKPATVYDLFGSAAERTELKNALAALASSGEQVKTLYLTVSGKPYLAAVSSLGQIGWFNLVLVNPARFVSSRDFLPVLAVIVVSTLVVIAIVGWLLNRLVLAPLSSLAESSEKIAAGDFDIQMPLRSDDEIGSLTRSFNAMTRMVKEYTDNLGSKVRERTEELDLSNRQLAESNRQIMDSIRFARLIQASILPEEVEIRRHVEDFFALYRPRDIVGGDFYYFRPAAQGCFLAVADCTGHGVPGAFMTMTAKAVLDRVLDEAQQTDPAAILKDYNRLMRDTLHHEKHGVAAIDNGLEIGLCLLAPAEGQLVFAGAKIDLFVETAGSVETIVGDKQAIGYRRSDVDFAYNSHILPLREGTTVYLTSDGLLDQAGEQKGWGFGKKRLNELLSSVAERPAAERKAAIAAELARYQGDTPQRDDITIIGFTLQQRNAGRNAYN